MGFSIDFSEFNFSGINKKKLFPVENTIYSILSKVNEFNVILLFMYISYQHSQRNESSKLRSRSYKKKHFPKQKIANRVKQVIEL